MPNFCTDCRRILQWCTQRRRPEAQNWDCFSQQEGCQPFCKVDSASRNSVKPWVLCMSWWAGGVFVTMQPRWILLIEETTQKSVLPALRACEYVYPMCWEKMDRGTSAVSHLLSRFQREAQDYLTVTWMICKQWLLRTLFCCKICCSSRSLTRVKHVHVKRSHSLRASPMLT